jgi:predicted nucleotidyltransferase
MAVTPEEAVGTLHARREREAALDAQAALEAERSLPRLTEWLANAGAREIHLFGSLAEGRFRRTSDIDLAVRGLAPRDASRASSALSRLAGRAVEVILLEDAPAGLTLRIERLGRRLE